MKKKVNIILNCFNGSEFLEECLKNIQNQTFKDWDLIFWDNCSTDNSSEIFKNFRDIRFKYFLAKKHTNLGEARELAIKETNCDFVAFIDVDDGWSKDKLEKQIEVFKDSKVGLSCSNYYIISNNNKKIFRNSKLPSGKITNQLLKDYHISWHTVMIRMEAFRDLNYIFNKNYHIINDFDLVLRISLNWNILSIDYPLGFMRVHNNQEMKKKKVLHIKENLRFILKKKNIFLYRGFSKFYYFTDKILYEKISYQIKDISISKFIRSVFLINSLILKIKLFAKYLLKFFIK
jgi:glycosyltransferase involved in cell wall biosynthesis